MHQIRDRGYKREDQHVRPRAKTKIDVLAALAMILLSSGSGGGGGGGAGFGIQPCAAAGVVARTTTAIITSTSATTTTPAISITTTTTTTTTTSPISTCADGHVQYKALPAGDGRGVQPSYNYRPRAPDDRGLDWPWTIAIQQSLPPLTSWRYSHPYFSGRRQRRQIETELDVENMCNQGFHDCRGLSTNICCPNTSYCIVDVGGKPLCCALGKRCDAQDPCNTTATYCEPIITVTQRLSGTGALHTSLVQTTSCCSRRCGTTLHVCAASFGGQCCGNDAVCVRGGECRLTPNPGPPFETAGKTTTTTTATVSMPCETGYVQCVRAVGGGCCPEDTVCTVSGGVAGCGPILKGSGGGATPTPSGNGTGTPPGEKDPSGSGGGGLNGAQKAGVGATLGLVGLGLVYLAAYVAMRWRAKRSGEPQFGARPAEAAAGVRTPRAPFSPFAYLGGGRTPSRSRFFGGGGGGGSPGAIKAGERYEMSGDGNGGGGYAAHAPQEMGGNGQYAYYDYNNAYGGPPQELGGYVPAYELGPGYVPPEMEAAGNYNQPSYAVGEQTPTFGHSSPNTLNSEAHGGGGGYVSSPPPQGMDFTGSTVQLNPNPNIDDGDRGNRRGVPSRRPVP
ncbi:hypothetical protein DFH27DRAFT_625452 [Peziza echinospora]|nr:hypothetical protein DFH27DRAFT_625452 [Peziza echinospora]